MDSLEEIQIPNESIISIDGSTDNTGISLIANENREILYTLAIKREDSETPVQYKVKLKRFLTELLLSRRRITRSFYEEPFLQYAETAKVLMMLRTSVEEVIAENSPHLDYLKAVEVSNTKWKKIFLAPDTVPNGHNEQKKAVMNKLLAKYPWLKGITQDEADACGLGIASLSKVEGHFEEQLVSKKPAKPFKYEIRFIGADNDDCMFEELTYSRKEWKIPEKVMENGIEVVDIDGRGLFDKKVYANMGSEDKLLILSFKPTTNGNIILKHNIGYLASTSERLYAVVWRKSRKK